MPGAETATRLVAIQGQVFSAILDLLSPPGCAACDAPIGGRFVFCQACAEAVLESPRTRVAGVEVVAAGAYGGPLGDAIRRLKFSDRPDLARPLGELLRTAALRSRLKPDLVVPVPLHPGRLIERGYNQAALLARRVVRTVAAPLDLDGLVRIRSNGPQTNLNAAARAANVRGAFHVRGRLAFAGLHVLLVDDVVTTGATLSACATALFAAGAATVAMLAVARVE